MLAVSCASWWQMRAGISPESHTQRCCPQANFRAEVLLLRMCRDRNVVGFRGASVTAKRMLMVMEVCAASASGFSSSCSGWLQSDQRCCLGCIMQHVDVPVATRPPSHCPQSTPAGS